MEKPDPGRMGAIIDASDNSTLIKICRSIRERRKREAYEARACHLGMKHLGEVPQDHREEARGNQAEVCLQGKGKAAFQLQEEVGTRRSHLHRRRADFVAAWGCYGPDLRQRMTR